MTSRIALWLTSWLVLGAPASFAQVEPSPDQWLTNRVSYPAAWSHASIQSNAFTELHAEVVAAKLVIRWTPDEKSPSNSVVVLASAAEFSHWPTRDWRAYPMVQVDGRWQAAIPVEYLDVPIAYFVGASSSRATNCSPMRGVLPRDVGLEEPTRLFWPFLEGFEQGFDSWRIVSRQSPNGMLNTNVTARNGYFSLSAAVPAGRRSCTVGTTRLRGWQARAEGATGVQAWLRTRQGAGRARFSLLTNSGTTNEVIAPWPNESVLNDQWQKVELQFSDLPGLRLDAVDLLAIDFIAGDATEFLIDDLQLLGPWKLDLE